MNITGDWPESQAEISPGLDISSIQDSDLLVYGQITSHINEQADTTEFINQKVVYTDNNDLPLCTGTDDPAC
jgi:hypothetical protein